MSVSYETWRPSSDRREGPFGCGLSSQRQRPGLICRCIRAALGLIVLAGSGGLMALVHAQQADSKKSADKPRLAVEFHQDFKNGAFDSRTMSRVGGDAERFVRTDPAGLRIRIPGGLNNHEAVGVAPRCRIHGDFEVTVSFTIVKADEPIRGYGVAATVWAETNTATSEAVTIERGIIPKEGERFTSTRISGYPLDRKYDVRRVRAQSRAGKLRMERAGTKVTTLFADGDEPFRPLRTVELGPEDVTLLRLGAETGMSDHSVEVLLEELTIRADALPGLRVAPAKEPEAATKSEERPQQ
jgi:hypothetical protein